MHEYLSRPDKDINWEFRIDRESIHYWIKELLEERRGDSFSIEDRAALTELKETKVAFSRYELLRDVLPSQAEETLTAEARRLAYEGMAELSEGLVYAQDVQAVIREAGADTDEVIDLVGVEIAQPDDDTVWLRARDGRLLPYDTLRALLVPEEDEDV